MGFKTLSQSNITYILSSCKDASARLYCTIITGVTLKTEILAISPQIRLLPARVSDAAALSALIANNMTHLGGFMPKVVRLHTCEAAEAYLQGVVESNGEGELLEWHIFTGETLCGAIRLNHIEPENRKVSMGYYVGAQFCGQGLATASIRAVLRFVFERLEFNRVQIKCASANLASQRVAERLGFSWEGMLRQAEMIDGAYDDHFVYGLLRSEFTARDAGAIPRAA